VTTPSLPRNPFLDLLLNREPISLSHALAILGAAVLAFVDANVYHFSDDPLLTFAAVLVVGELIALVYARWRAWSPASVDGATVAAHRAGQRGLTNPILPAVKR
jgi:hypothetical protein